MHLPTSLREGVIAWVPEARDWADSLPALLAHACFSEPRSALAPAQLLDRLAAELALDPERVRLWTLARAVEGVLWCYEWDEEAPEDLALALALV